MKRIIATVAFVGLCQIVAFGQNKYEMVVEKTDGSETVLNVEDVARTYFRQRYTSCPDSNHPHMIDLGLPSGTKWACCNVGASKPEEYGGYYAWGETVEKSVYEWNTYIHCDGEYGPPFHDIGSDIAGTCFDAATANWGALWRMPSLKQIQELLNSCTSEWTNKNDVSGWKFVGPNGGTIFLPSAGYRLHSSVIGDGWYWSSTLDTSNPSHAYCIYFYSAEVSCGGFGYGHGRFCGYPVRPVRRNL